ncbi:hypothetical protein DL93DRAFT_2073886 [Clavulina sp. PMI_390]|nr:hypothetical protein DL93DRAFT_2073886 [Clavulina sp. PMI_390]
MLNTLRSHQVPRKSILKHHRTSNDASSGRPSFAGGSATGDTDYQQALSDAPSELRNARPSLGRRVSFNSNTTVRIFQQGSPSPDPDEDDSPPRASFPSEEELSPLQRKLINNSVKHASAAQTSPSRSEARVASPVRPIPSRLRSPAPQISIPPPRDEDDDDMDIADESEYINPPAQEVITTAAPPPSQPLPSQAPFTLPSANLPGDDEVDMSIDDSMEMAARRDLGSRVSVAPLTSRLSVRPRDSDMSLAEDFAPSRRPSVFVADTSAMSLQEDDSEPPDEPASQDFMVPLGTRVPRTDINGQFLSPSQKEKDKAAAIAEFAAVAGLDHVNQDDSDDDDDVPVVPIRSGSAFSVEDAERRNRAASEDVPLDHDDEFTSSTMSIDTTRAFNPDATVNITQLRKSMGKLSSPSASPPPPPAPALPPAPPSPSATPLARVPSSPVRPSAIPIPKSPARALAGAAKLNIFTTSPPQSTQPLPAVEPSDSHPPKSQPQPSTSISRPRSPAKPPSKSPAPPKSPAPQAKPKPTFTAAFAPPSVSPRKRSLSTTSPAPSPAKRRALSVEPPRSPEKTRAALTLGKGSFRPTPSGRKPNVKPTSTGSASTATSRGPFLTDSQPTLSQPAAPSNSVTISVSQTDKENIAQSSSSSSTSTKPSPRQQDVPVVDGARSTPPSVAPNQAQTVDGEVIVQPKRPEQVPPQPLASASGAESVRKHRNPFTSSPAKALPSRSSSDPSAPKTAASDLPPSRLSASTSARSNRNPFAESSQSTTTAALASSTASIPTSVVPPASAAPATSRPSITPFSAAPEPTNAVRNRMSAAYRRRSSVLPNRRRESIAPASGSAPTSVPAIIEEEVEEGAPVSSAPNPSNDVDDDTDMDIDEEVPLPSPNSTQASAPARIESPKTSSKPAAPRAALVVEPKDIIRTDGEVSNVSKPTSTSTYASRRQSITNTTADKPRRRMSFAPRARLSVAPEEQPVKPDVPSQASVASSSQKPDPEASQPPSDTEAGPSKRGQSRLSVTRRMSLAARKSRRSSAQPASLQLVSGESGAAVAANPTEPSQALSEEISQMSLQPTPRKGRRSNFTRASIAPMIKLPVSSRASFQPATQLSNVEGMPLMEFLQQAGHRFDTIPVDLRIQYRNDGGEEAPIEYDLVDIMQAVSVNYPQLDSYQDFVKEMQAEVDEYEAECQAILAGADIEPLAITQQWVQATEAEREDISLDTKIRRANAGLQAHAAWYPWRLDNTSKDLERAIAIREDLEDLGTMVDNYCDNVPRVLDSLQKMYDDVRQALDSELAVSAELETCDQGELEDLRQELDEQTVELKDREKAIQVVVDDVEQVEAEHQRLVSALEEGEKALASDEAKIAQSGDNTEAGAARLESQLNHLQWMLLWQIVRLEPDGIELIYDSWFIVEMNCKNSVVQSVNLLLHPKLSAPHSQFPHVNDVLLDIGRKRIGDLRVKTPRSVVRVLDSLWASGAQLNMSLRLLKLFPLLIEREGEYGISAKAKILMKHHSGRADVTFHFTEDIIAECPIRIAEITYDVSLAYGQNVTLEAIRRRLDGNLGGIPPDQQSYSVLGSACVDLQEIGGPEELE